LKLAALPAAQRATTAVVDLEFVEDGAAHLVGGGWRAALEVDPLNLALQGESERNQIWRQYRRALSALPAAVSLYSLSTPRIWKPDAVIGSAASGRRELAEADSEFQGGLVRDHLIQDQRHLVVVWADPPIAPLTALGRLGRRGAYGRDRPAVDLDQRCAAVAASLRQAGVRCHRLEDGEWMELIQRCTGGHSERRSPNFPSWLAPERVEIESHELRVDGRWVRSLAIGGFPRRVALGWLAPLLLAPSCDLRLVQHIYPVAKLASLTHLRRRIRSFETSLQVDHLRGHRPDRGTSVALGDALELEERVLLEEERLFRMAIFVTLEASSKSELEQSWHQLGSCLAEMGCGAVPLSNRQVDGWRATLPLGSDPIGWGRDMTSSALATALPFMRANLSSTSGVLLGPSLVSRELVVVDPFSDRNPNFNLIVLGTSGAGKSYTAKLLASRLAVTGCRIRCLDPAGEYIALADLLNGQVVRLGAGPESGLNALGPPQPEDGGSPGQSVGRRAAMALPILERLVAGREDGPGISEEQAEQLERVLLQLLEVDPAGACLAGLVAALERAGMERLAGRLRHFTKGVDAGIFDGGETSGLAAASVVSLSLIQRDRERLLPAIMQMVLLHLEAELAVSPELPRLILVDEAEVLLASPRSAIALESLSRRLRKLGAGLLVISQVVEDFLGSPVGNVVIRNCHTKLLLRQEEVAIPAVRDAFGLSPAECDLLRDADQGSGLVLVGRERAAFSGAAPPAWQAALRTDVRRSGERT
jgi:hypothetical protein